MIVSYNCFSVEQGTFFYILAEKHGSRDCDLTWTLTQLTGDNIRLGLNRDLAFSEEDRKENIRRIAEVPS